MNDLLNQIIDVQVRNVTSTTQTRDLNTTLILAKFTDSKNRKYAVYTDPKQALDDGHSLDSYVYNAVRLILTQEPHPLRVVVAPVQGTGNSAYIETFRSLLRIPQGWFHLISDLRHTDTQFALAQLVETTEKFYTAGTHEAIARDPNVTTDLSSRIKTAGLAQTTVFFDDPIEGDGEEPDPDPDPEPVDPDPELVDQLNSAITNAEIEVAKTDVYTPESLTVLQSAIDQAKNANTNATINTALTNLQNAINQLVEIEQPTGVCEDDCQGVSSVLNFNPVTVPTSFGGTANLLVDIDGVVNVHPNLSVGTSMASVTAVQQARSDDPTFMYGFLQFGNEESGITVTNLQNKCVTVRIGLSKGNVIGADFVELENVQLCENTATAVATFRESVCGTQCQNSYMNADITDPITEFGTYPTETTSADYVINVNGVEYTTTIEVPFGSMNTRGQVLSNIISNNTELMNTIRYNYDNYRVDNQTDQCLLVYVKGTHSKTPDVEFLVIKPILICPKAEEQSECDINCVKDTLYGDSYMPLPMNKVMYLGEGSVAGKYVYVYNDEEYEFPIPNGVDFEQTSVAEIIETVADGSSPLMMFFTTATDPNNARMKGIKNNRSECSTLEIFYEPTTPVATGYERVSIVDKVYICPNGVDKTAEIEAECLAECVPEVLASDYVGVDIPSGLQTVELKLWINGVQKGGSVIRNVTDGAVTGTTAMYHISQDSAISYMDFRASTTTSGAYYNPQAKCQIYSITTELQGQPSTRQYVMKDVAICPTTT